MDGSYKISDFKSRVPDYHEFILNESTDSNLREFVNYIKSNLVHTHMQNVEYDWMEVCRNYPMDKDQINSLKDDNNVMSMFAYEVYDDMDYSDHYDDEELSSWAEDTAISYISEAIDVIDGCWIYVERRMTLKKERYENYEKYLNDNYKGFAGAYWTYAEGFGTDYAGVQSGDSVLIRGRVPISRVDWPDTKLRNLTMPEEKELSLQKDTLVRVDSILVNNHVVFKPKDEVYVKTY